MIETDGLFEIDLSDRSWIITPNGDLWHNFSLYTLKNKKPEIFEVFSNDYSDAEIFTMSIDKLIKSGYIRLVLPNNGNLMITYSRANSKTEKLIKMFCRSIIEDDNDFEDCCVELKTMDKQYHNIKTVKEVVKTGSSFITSEF